MGSAKSEGTKPKHQTLQLVERSEQKRLLQLYILSSHLAADAAGRAQQKALTRPPGLQDGGYCGWVTWGLWIVTSAMSTV